MNMRQSAGLLLAVLLALSVTAGIVWSHRQQLAQTTQSQPSLLTVRGLIGSEKQEFFADARVQARLAALGLQVSVQKAGSREIAERYDPQQFDFGFPSGAPAARLQQLAGRSDSVVPFYTPMVIASWQPIVRILQDNGLVEQRQGIYYLTRLPALLDLMQQQRRWRDLQGSAAFATGKAVLISTTDLRSSNSAAMYLALASYVLNGEQVVQGPQQVARLLPQLTPLFLRQGFQEGSSAAPFEDYVALGMGKTPLLLAYESQLVALWLRHPERKQDGMVLIYPQPTLYSKHVLVPFTPAGVQLAQALATDPMLQTLAQSYGFRTRAGSEDARHWAAQGIQVPEQLQEVIDPPAYVWLEAMITAILQQETAGGQP